jgi:hypothetical protein
MLTTFHNVNFFRSNRRSVKKPQMSMVQARGSICGLWMAFTRFWLDVSAFAAL